MTRVRNPPGVGALPAADQRAGEDQPDLVGAAQVEVVADDLLEEDPAGDRLVEHLGQGELGLQHRDLVPVAGDAVRRGERMRQPAQPLAQQRVDLRRAEPVADRLDRGRVVDSGEPVVQRGRTRCLLGGLAFGPLVAVDAQLGVVGEVGAELEEERAEVVVEAVEVEVVDQRRCSSPATHMQSPCAGRRRFSVRITALLLRPTHVQHSLTRVATQRQHAARRVTSGHRRGGRTG